MEELIQYIDKSSKMKELTLMRAKVGNDKEEQEVSEQLPEVLSSNTNIKKLYLDNTDLIGSNNVNH